MDFYVPFAEHRLTWQATPDLAVGWTMDVDDSRVGAFTPAGELVIYDAAQGLPQQTLFVLHPAEQKSPRINPQPASPGRTIQDPTDGELSGSIVFVTANSDTAFTQLTNLAGGGGGRSSRPNAQQGEETVTISSTSIDTYLDGFEIHFGDGVGSAEIEWTAKYYSGSCSGTPTETGIIRYEGVDEGTPYNTSSYLVGGAPTDSSQCMLIELVETDEFQQDYKGNTNVYHDDEGVMLHTRDTESNETSDFIVNYVSSSDGGGGGGGDSCIGDYCMQSEG